MANKIEEIIQELNLDLKVAYIDGDDLIPRFEELKKANEPLANMEKYFSSRLLQKTSDS